MDKKFIGHWILILTSFIGNSVAIFVRWLEVSPVIMTFYTQLFAVMVLVFYLVLKRKFKEIPLNKKIIPLVLVGLFALVNFLTTFLAYQKTTIANVILVFNIAPIIVVLLTPVFVDEDYEKRIFGLLIIAFLGIFVMIDTSNLSLSNTEFLGIILSFLSAVSWSFMVLISKRSLSETSSLNLTFFQSLVGVIILFPYIVWNGLFIFSTKLLVMGFQGILLYALNPVLFYNALKIVKTQHASLLAFLNPMIAIIYGIIFFNEIPGMDTLIGGGMIFSVALYLTLSSRRNPK